MTRRRRRRRRHQWSYLPGELLELILEKLDLADHARFASVCSSWRSVAVEKPPITKPLSFVLSHHPERLIGRFITSFIPSWEGVRFIGAGLDGWLVVLIDGRNLFLLNKGFNSIISLPRPPKRQKEFLSKAVLSSPPLPSSSSSGECTVVVSHLARGTLYSCRVGLDTSFTKTFSSSIVIHDILFYEGRLYVLFNSNTITIFDHLLNKETRLVTHLGDIPVPNCGLNRLLISGNKLLVVGKSHKSSLVFKVERSKPWVVRVNDVDGKLLVLNNFCSLSITANEHMEFRRNHFQRNYYTYHLNRTYVIDRGLDPYQTKITSILVRHERSHPQVLLSTAADFRWCLSDRASMEPVGGVGSFLDIYIMRPT